MPLIVAEPSTAAIQRLLARDHSMIVWWATEVECVSAVARLEHDGDLTPQAVEESLSRLDSLRESWHEVQPLEPVRRAARRLLRVHRLRTADALQLAAALTASEGNAASLEMVCLDERLAHAARREGMPVVTEIPA